MIVAEVTEKDLAGSACFPNPLITLAISVNGDEVGSCIYAVSPPRDCVYVFQIEISDKYKRKGYGTATICYLYDQIGLPITPYAPRHSDAASGFWRAMQNITGINVTEGISMSEFDYLSSKWNTAERVAAQQAAINESNDNKLKNLLGN